MNPETTARAEQGSTSFAAPPATNFVLFDDHCPLCTFQMKMLTWLDWFNMVTWLPISDARAPELVPGLTREDLLEAIHCVAKDGRIYRGARCIRYAGMRIPLLVPIALVLWFPGVIWVAEKFYMWIARNRLVLSRLFGCQGACAIMPVRKQAGEPPAALDSFK